MFSDIQIKRDIYGSDEHKMLIESFWNFLEAEAKPYHDQWEKDRMVDRAAWLKAGELGFLCLDVPEEYGGAGLDYTFNAVITELGSKSGYTGLGFSLHSDIVVPYFIHYGTEAQKKKFLPKMASGEWISCIGMTEPNTGSDLQAIKTNAVDKGDYYLVNGSKTFITNGYLSDFSIVACKTNVGTEREGISLIIIENSEGYSKGKPFEKLGLKANDTCELFFEDVKVPKENLLGEEGKGFIYMMKELPRERLSVAINAIGGSEGAIEETVKYTQERRAFKRPIAGFQNTQFKLADQAAQLQVHQVYVDKCIELLCENKLTAEQASIAKLTCTEMHSKLVDECLQLFGGYGFMWEYPIAKNYADSRVARIYAGTNEIMKILISRGLFREYFQEMKKMRAKKNA